MATTLDLILMDTRQLNTISFADTSVYQATPTNVSFEVTVPGYDKVNAPFVPRVVNIFNFDTLGINADGTLPLPDGIYAIRYSVSPNSVLYIEKTFMRTLAIKAKYQRKFLAIRTDCNCSGNYKGVMEDKLRDIEILINLSIASANQCDSVTAYDAYNKANNLLDKLSICDC